MEDFYCFAFTIHEGTKFYHKKFDGHCSTCDTAEYMKRIIRSGKSVYSDKLYTSEEDAVKGLVVAFNALKFETSCIWHEVQEAVESDGIDYNDFISVIYVNKEDHLQIRDEVSTVSELQKIQGFLCPKDRKGLLFCLFDFDIFVTTSI